MEVRQFEDGDLRGVQELHAASGFQYDLPSVSDPRIFSKLVVCDESGLGMAAFLQRTAQVFLICQPNWKTPAWRMEALRQLHIACREDAAKDGIAEVNAFLPPQISKRFGNRLTRLGWKSYQGEEWKCFSYELGGY